MSAGYRAASGARSLRIAASLATAAFPTKVGIQIHPERLVGLTWAPTFVGEADEGETGAL